MEVTLSQVSRCPYDMELCIFCRLVSGDENTVILEDLFHRSTREAVLTGDANIPEEWGMPVCVEGKVNYHDSLEVSAISVVENQQLFDILTDPKRLKLLEYQTLRGLKVLESRRIVSDN